MDRGQGAASAPPPRTVPLSRDNMLLAIIRDTGLSALDRDLGEIVNVLLGKAKGVIIQTTPGFKVSLAVLEEEASIYGRDEA